MNFSIHALSKIARAVYDVEEATATAFEIILEHKVVTIYRLLRLLLVFGYFLY